MTETQSALRMLGRLPANVLIKNPAGTWSFVGSVDPRLAYETADGGFVDAETCRLIASHGFGIMRKIHGLQTKVWSTEQAAREFAAEIGVEVSA